MLQKIVLLLFLSTLAGFASMETSWGESKVYLVNGETRVGFVLVRHGRVTVRGVDRLFQYSEEAIHRIEHVTGETTLIGRDGILLREKPERLSKTLVAVPKGCEVYVLEAEGDWVKIRVYAGRDEAIGYLHVDDLSDEVLFNLVDPRIRFKAPPSNLKDLVDREAIRRNMERQERARRGEIETTFAAEPAASTAAPEAAPEAPQTEDSANPQ